MKITEITNRWLTVYRGEYSGNRGGNYFTPDREWARQFTQSGRDAEIKQRFIREADIFRPPQPVYAGDPDARDQIAQVALQHGFKAVWLDEGQNQPDSIYVFDRTALRFQASESAEPAPFRTFYHCTPHTRVASILRTGLGLGRRRQWKNVMGRTLGSVQHVYLFSDLDAAIQLAARLEWGMISLNRRSTQIDILEIHTDAPVVPDPNLESQLRPGTWWMTDHEIPPDQIVKVIPLTLQMKRDFIARRDSHK